MQINSLAAKSERVNLKSVQDYLLEHG